MTPVLVRTQASRLSTILRSSSRSTAATLSSRLITTVSGRKDTGMTSQTAKVLRSEALTDGDSKWIGLKAIYWRDPKGNDRKWESADRRTRKGDCDAVAICTVIYRPSSEPHLLLISQFRPPVNQSVIEMPAGLIDEGEEGDEGAKRAALRELEEETGYGTANEGGKVDVELITNIMWNDPGMSGANMKLCMVRIDLADDAPDPVAKPEEGEFIEKHLVPLKTLMKSLTDFQSKGFAVDARLAHLAVGLELAAKFGSPSKM
ncbi:hypothetical protein CBS101457_006703 [Exobasidium rhododendri]|nr:hypothetical protein CBS101457_006703 [Exobasidium rhododendri]